jgi:hypothetical protein
VPLMSDDALHCRGHLLNVPNLQKHIELQSMLISSNMLSCSIINYWYVCYNKYLELDLLRLHPQHTRLVIIPIN